MESYFFGYLLEFMADTSLRNLLIYSAFARESTVEVLSIKAALIMPSLLATLETLREIYMIQEAFYNIRKS